MLPALGGGSGTRCSPCSLQQINSPVSLFICFLQQQGVRELAVPLVVRNKSILPFPYSICFSRQEGVQELDVPLVVCPLRWFICLLGHGSFDFVPWLKGNSPLQKRKGRNTKVNYLSCEPGVTNWHIMTQIWMNPSTLVTWIGMCSRCWAGR
jgi:hypothetical protein